MPARTYVYAESTGDSTTTSLTYVNKVSVDLTPENGESYLVMATFLVGRNSVTNDILLRLYNSTDATTLQELNIEVQDVTDFLPVTMMGIFTASGTSQKTFVVQYAGETSSITTIKEARILVMKLGANDKFNTVSGRTTSSSTTFTTTSTATVTFTPPTTGNYLLLATASVDSGSTAQECYMAIDVGGTRYAQVGGGVKDTTSVTYINTSKVLSLNNASQTVSIAYASSFAGVTVGIKQMTLIALRLDDFDFATYGEQTTQQSTTSDSYVELLTDITFTPRNLAHLIVGTMALGSASSSQSLYSRMTQDGSALTGESLIEISSIASAADSKSFGQMLVKTLSASSTSFNIEYRSEVAGTTMYADEINMAVLQLEATPSDITFVKATTASGSGSSLTFSVIVDSGTSRALVLKIGVFDSNEANRPVTSATFNSVGFTKVDHSDTGSGTSERAEMWRLANPTVGTYDVVVNVTGSVSQITAIAEQWNGVDQTTPIEASATANGSSSSASGSVTNTTAGAWVVDAMASEPNITAVPLNQSLKGEVEPQTYQTLGGSASGPYSSSASRTHSYTLAYGARWRMVIGSLKPASGGGGSPYTPRSALLGVG